MTDLMPPFSLRGVTRVCVIGGGDILFATTRYLTEAGVPVCAVLAPRHATEHLPIAGGCLSDRLEALEIPTHMVDDINAPGSWPIEAVTGAGSLALCFGPSWIFATRVIDAFEHGMINVNQIPVPRYLGGAHYTWQILHGDRSGGCFLQQITPKVDRGDILMRHSFTVPVSARTPRDYFEANFTEGCQCMRQFVELIKAKGALHRQPYADVEDGRLYFPRLRTAAQAYIDWRWSAEEIERFCNAFDDPYDGAMSFVGDNRIHLRDVRCTADVERFHPFSAGLVVRRTDEGILVAAGDGVLVIGRAETDESSDGRHLLREGIRLTTPSTVLDQASAYIPRLTARGYQ